MRVHFIAIGGSAMHNLALALHNAGHIVSGSDDEIFEPSRSRLDEKGLLPENYGWFPENINEKIEVVILGMHAKPDNPELARAREINLKIVSYPEFLFQQSLNKKRIVIGGSHGKTTITSMVMHVLSKMKVDFDYMVGSKIKGFDVMVRLSDAPIIILEGDEYLSSPIDRRPKFHWYKPHLAVLTGIAWDHINVFPTFENYTDQFLKFVDLMMDDSKLFYFKDDAVLTEVIGNAKKSVLKIPYGLPVNKIVDGISYVQSEGKSIPLSVFGNHNLINLNAAQLVCNELGISNDDFFLAIKSFDGASNRLELVNKKNSCLIYKDFAHAPSKVIATVNAVRNQYLDKKFVACLELHTFSSLNSDFIGEYAGSLDLADKACVYFNPHALKLKRLPSLEKEEVRKAFKRNDIAVFNDSKEMQEWILNQKSNNVVFLMMSSGNFDGIDLHEFSKSLM
jgi:UDP-N-acetylmuramate: L-alanyl-gamma-D-glutamyl-meso-diaminopimelate ligase